MSLLNKIQRKLYKATHPKIGEILMFHRVLQQRSSKDDALNYAIEVTPECLEQTILHYQEAGYRLVSLDDFYEALTRKSLFHRPQKMVCFTFDDGFVDNYTIAYPIFKKYNCPFIIYVTSGFVDKTALIWWCHETTPGEKSLALSVEQLKELANDSLCTIGAHTVSHPQLADLSYQEQLAEMRESKQRLERLLQRPIDHLSYPHGSYNSDTEKIAKQCGFKTATRNYGDTIRHGDNLYTLNRKYIKED